MKKEIKDLWVKALRSGEFQQCKGRLEKQINGEVFYCALGVLSALALVEGICTYAPGGRFDGKRFGLSYNIREWAEIKEERGEIEDEPLSIAQLNDKGLSFKAIADIIERHWSEL